MIISIKLAAIEAQMPLQQCLGIMKPLLDSRTPYYQYQSEPGYRLRAVLHSWPYVYLHRKGYLRGTPEEHLSRNPA